MYVNSIKFQQPKFFANRQFFLNIIFLLTPFANFRMCKKFHKIFTFKHKFSAILTTFFFFFFDNRFPVFVSNKNFIKKNNYYCISWFVSGISWAEPASQFQYLLSGTKVNSGCRRGGKFRETIRNLKTAPHASAENFFLPFTSWPRKFLIGLPRSLCSRVSRRYADYEK